MTVGPEVLPEEILGAMGGLSPEEQAALKAAITTYIAGQKAVPTTSAKEGLLATPPTKTSLEQEKEELKAGMEKFQTHKSPMGLDADSKFIDLFQQAMKTMQQVGSKPMEFVQSFTGLLQLEGQLANFLSAIAEGTFADEDVRKMVANGLKSYITAYIGKMILDKEGNLLTEVAKNDMPGNATAILQKVRDQIATARTAPTLTPKKAPAELHPAAAEAAQHSAKAAAHFADAAVKASNTPNHKENHPEHETHVAAAGKHFENSKAHADSAAKAVSPEHAEHLRNAAASSAEAAGHSAAAAKAANAEAAAPHVEASNQAAAAAEAHAAKAVEVSAKTAGPAPADAPKAASQQELHPAAVKAAQHAAEAEGHAAEIAAHAGRDGMTEGQQLGAERTAGYAAAAKSYAENAAKAVSPQHAELLGNAAAQMAAAAGHSKNATTARTLDEARPHITAAINAKLAAEKHELAAQEHAANAAPKPKEGPEATASAPVPVVVPGTIVPAQIKEGLSSAASSASSLASRGYAALALPFQKKEASAPPATLESLRAARAQTQLATKRSGELEGAATKKEKVEIAKKHAEEDAAASAAKTASLNHELDNFRGTAEQYVQKQAELAAHETTAAQHQAALDTATRNEARVKGSYLNALGMNAVDAAKSAKRGVGAIGSTLAAPVTSLRKNANALNAFTAANGIVDAVSSQFAAKYAKKSAEEEALLQAEEDELAKKNTAAQQVDRLERRLKNTYRDIIAIEKHLKNLKDKKAKVEAANVGLPLADQTETSPFDQQIQMVTGTKLRAEKEKKELEAKLTELTPPAGGTRRRRARGSTRKRARKKRKQKKRPRRRATGRRRNSRQTAKGRTYFTADDPFF
jgi:hypothetical protein